MMSSRWLLRAPGLLTSAVSQPRRWLLVAPGLLTLAVAQAPHPVPAARGLPPLVFVSREPAPGGSQSVIPGLGPHGRTLATGGRLLVRSANGRVGPLLRDRAFFDVSDPSVSWDGARVAFAATPSPDSAWRIFAVNADGSGLTQVTRSNRSIDLAPLGAAAARFQRYDDFDPCWLPDGRLCFASTRFPQVAEMADVPTTNLFVVRADGTGLTRITSERNGAEEPSVDGETGHIVYARWWLNRYLPSNEVRLGVTTDRARAIPFEDVNLWQAISVTPDGDLIRLAGGNPRVRPETMAYQPIVLADGTLIGVQAEQLSLTPRMGSLSLLAFPGRFAAPIRLPGGDPGASACSPAVLPGGRIAFSYDPGGSGDFGLYAVRVDGRRLERILDLPGTLELDAAVLAPRRAPPILVPTFMDQPRVLPAAQERELKDSVTTFRFDCLNVFANAPVDAPFPDAPPAARDLRIRFYATLSRPSQAGGDSVILLREAPITRTGAVHEHSLPADTPMFEQLVDAHGRVLRSTTGPAHVPGFNSGRYGGGTKCVGCHIGHSAIPVAYSAHEGTRFNVSPSAEVSASSVAPGSASARAVVDRRTQGPIDQVAWVAGSAQDQYIRLTWQTPIEVDTVVIYAISPRFSDGSNLRVRECLLVFLRNGREVHQTTIRGELSPLGTRVACRGIRVDGIEVRPTRITGRVHQHEAVALAEIETLARLSEQ